MRITSKKLSPEAIERIRVFGHMMIRLNREHAAAMDDFLSRHPGGANFLLGDGSVRQINNTISPKAWVALGTRAGGEVVSAE